MSFKLEEKIFEFTEKAAISCFDWIGKNDRMKADERATSSLREALNEFPYGIKVVIGEGERDKAPMLYIGEKLGKGEIQYDLAVDPLEGTNLCALNQKGACSVLAMSEKGGLLQAPDSYMDKLACSHKAKDLCHLDFSATKNIELLAKALNKKVSEIKVVILERDRHKDLINEVRDIGADLKLIKDGDLSAALSIYLGEDKVDLLLGSGGAPEGVLLATAFYCLGGHFQGRLIFSDTKQKKRAYGMGLENLDQILNISDLVKKEPVFSMTAVTKGDFLEALFKKEGKIHTHSLVLSSQKGIKYHSNSYSY